MSSRAYDQHRLRSATGSLRRKRIRITDKGIGTLAGLTPSQLAARNVSLFELDLPTPHLVLFDSAVQTNVAAMAQYCAARNLLLAPHAKTTMAPEIFARPLAAGAWGLSAATFQQVRVLRHFGVRRVLLANEFVDPAAIRWVGTELRRDSEFEFWCYVDSVAGVQRLDQNIGLGHGGRRLPVLVEVGHSHGRGGVRSVAEAIEVARAAASTESLRVIGASGFEGTIGSDAGPETLDAVHCFVREIAGVGEALRAHGALNSAAGETPGPTELVLSAGGSCFFDIVAGEMMRESAGDPDRLVVLRAGSYVAHDHGLLGRLSPFVRGTAGDGRVVPALELWARIISRPEAHLAMADVGKRDVSVDIDWPVVLAVRRTDGTMAHGRAEVVAMNDQHAYVKISDSAYCEVGDLVALGVSHACTTFDKWRTLLLVSDDYRVLDVVHTFF